MINLMLIGAFEGLFLAALLLMKRRRTISDTILAAYFLLFAANIFLSYMEAYNRHNGFPYPGFLFTAPPLLLLHGPLLWLYVKSLTDQYFKLKPVYLINLIPFVLMVLQQAFMAYSLPAPVRIEYTINEEFKNSLSYPFFLTLIAISPIFYFYLGIRLIRDYEKRIVGYFSQTARIDLKWLYFIIISWISLSLLINSFFIVDLFHPIAPFGLMQYISFLIASVYVIFIGFNGLRQENVFLTRTIAIDLEKTLEPRHEAMPAKPMKDSEKEFVRLLLKHMGEQKPYLQPEITLKALSDELQVSSEYLSGVINADLNMSFFDFINHYRIEEFKKQCHDEKNKHLSIIGMAFNCGFNSKATFNRVFKKATGLTPSKYMQQSQ